MMKKMTLALLLAGAISGPALAAGFVGFADPANFAVGNTGTLTGGSPNLGTAVFSATGLVLTGSDSISPSPADYTPGCAGGIYMDLSSPCQIQALLSRSGSYTFDWAYVSNDYCLMNITFFDFSFWNSVFN